MLSYWMFCQENCWHQIDWLNVCFIIYPVIQCVWLDGLVLVKFCNSYIMRLLIQKSSVLLYQSWLHMPSCINWFYQSTAGSTYWINSKQNRHLNIIFFNNYSVLLTKYITTTIMAARFFSKTKTNGILISYTAF